MDFIIRICTRNENFYLNSKYYQLDKLKNFYLSFFIIILFNKKNFIY